MASVTVTGFTAARMLQIEQASVVGGTIVGTNLRLTTRGGQYITAGSVLGPEGPRGIPGGVVDATTAGKGGVKLAGNLKGTADLPMVTGALDGLVDTSLTRVSGTYNFGSGSETIVSSAREMLGIMTGNARSVANLLTRVIFKGGTASTIWSGTEAQYNALAPATRNAAGFIAVIAP